MKRWYFAR